MSVKTKAVTKPYEPTPSERERLDKFEAARKENPRPPKVKFSTEGGTAKIDFDHPDQMDGAFLLMDALGTRDTAFFAGILSQVINVASSNEDSANFMLSVISDLEPQDHVEAMLAAQMAAVHMATMTFARRLSQVENIPQQDSAERALNKLARTFAPQMEALKRYRTGGQQKMVVEHVTVNEGGQAIRRL